MVKYVVQMTYKEEGQEFVDYIDCESIEQYNEAKKELANDDLELKLFELKEVEGVK